MKYPTGMLKNTATGRFHPISFRPAPLPGPDGDKAHRYRSLGHHTEGFETEAEANAFVAANAHMELIENSWEWDGTGVPALTTFITSKEDAT